MIVFVEEPSELTEKEVEHQTKFPLLVCPACMETFPGFEDQVNVPCFECKQGQLQQAWYKEEEDAEV